MQFKYMKQKFALDNLGLFDQKYCVGKFQIPKLMPAERCPNKLICFSNVNRMDDFSVGVHFFMDDFRFERIWKMPNRYIPLLKKFSCVLSPDFSLFADMPVAQQIWNVYRSRLLGFMMQRVGIEVIPVVSWSDKQSFEFCFDGIAKGGLVAVSSVGSIKNKYDRIRFVTGLNAMIDRLTPSSILFYGKIPEFDFKNIKIHHFYTCREMVGAISYKESL